MNIAFLGYGQVGAPLADHLQRLGHQVTLAANDPRSERLKTALAKNPNLDVAAPREAVRQAEVVFLATPFQANQAAIEAVADEMRGKILIDCTNPVGANLSHGLNSLESGSELIQRMAPEAKVVKAFTIYGFENFEDTSYPGYNVKPVMMYCGNDMDAKKVVGELIAQLGWSPLDVGGLEQALHLEHMTLLWVRMVRVMGQSPH
ncbi:MAG: NADPH-dependent F420 reductase, partial [Chromatiaceae bacterium]|nr:NADPH-dependent F420 reductase [Candidatus Thioaporhodococcus sediminis]